jgi:hypothetical protein
MQYIKCYSEYLFNKKIKVSVNKRDILPNKNVKERAFELTQGISFRNVSNNSLVRRNINLLPYRLIPYLLALLIAILVLVVFLTHLKLKSDFLRSSEVVLTELYSGQIQSLICQDYLKILLYS